jgi:HK97 family phage portal protein
MPILQRIREWWQIKRQPVLVNIIDTWQAGRPLTPTYDVRKFTEDGYRRNSLIFACITEIATSFAQPELEAYREVGEDEVDLEDNHPLAILLDHPNKRQSMRAFLREMSTHLDVAGNAYIWKQRSGARLPVALYLLRPDQVRPIVAATGEIEGYAYGVEPKIQLIPAEDIIHEMAHPDPIDPFRGVSPIAVLARAGDLDNSAMDYLRAFFANAGIPSGLLKFKTQVEKNEAERIRQLWRERYSGPKGWHDVSVIDADVEYQEIGSKIRTMDLSGVFSTTESRICSAFDVPPILVGSWIGLQSASYANYENARKSFYQETLSPRWASVSDRFTVDLAAEFGEDIELYFNLSEIDALQEEQAEERKYALDAWNAGLITRNEARTIVDLDPIDGGDVIKSTTQDIFVDVEELAGAGGMPLPAGNEEEEAGRLIAPEFWAATPPIPWRQIQALADRAAPAVKKKSWRRSSRQRTE